MDRSPTVQQSDNRYNPTNRALPFPENANYALGPLRLTRTPSGAWYATSPQGWIRVVGEDVKRMEELV